MYNLHPSTPRQYPLLQTRKVTHFSHSSKTTTGGIYEYFLSLQSLSFFDIGVIF